MLDVFNILLFFNLRFESTVNSYDYQTITDINSVDEMFESTVNSYDYQTFTVRSLQQVRFESTVNSFFISQKYFKS